MQVKSSTSATRSSSTNSTQSSSSSTKSAPKTAEAPRTETRAPANATVQAGTRSVTSARDQAAASALNARLATTAATGNNPPAAGTQVTTTTNVNLRTSPQVDANGKNVVGTIPASTTVQVTPDASGATERKGFLHVSWNDGGKSKEGWISKEYTKPGAATPAAQPAGSPPPNALVTTDNVNLRSTPQVDKNGNNVIKTIPANTVVQATPDAKGVTTKDGFVHVSWADGATQREGWISQQYAKAPPAPAATQPAAPAAPGTGQPAGTSVYTQDVLNLRPGPSTNNEPIKEIPGGQKLDVTKDPVTGKTSDGDFLHVSWNDGGTKRDGWVYGPYTKTQPPAAPAATGTPAAAGTPAATGQAGQTMEAAQANFVNQFAAEKELTDPATGKPGDGTNQNCGPSSLVMALRSQDLSLKPIPGLQANPADGANGTAVQQARWWSTAGDANDGTVTTNGVTTYAPMNGPKGATENSQITTLPELQAGVRNAGGKSDYVTDAQGNTTSAAIATALSQNKSVIVSGSFYEDNKVKTDAWKPAHGSVDHVVAVTGTTSDGKFIVSDPAYDKPITVSADQLDAFLRGGNGYAISVYK